MPFRIAIFFVLLSAGLIFLFQSCQKADKIEAPIPFITLPDFICAYGNTPFDSVAIQKFDSGNLFSITFLNEGQPHGQQLFYHENGEVKTRRYFCMGEINGPLFTFFEDGSLQSRGYYHQGRMSGSWRYYYPGGKLKEVVYFIENQERGPFREYFENGQLKASGFYIGEEKEHGLLYLYTESGELKRKMRCNNGICTTIST